MFTRFQSCPIRRRRRPFVGEPYLVEGGWSFPFLTNEKSNGTAARAAFFFCKGERMQGIFARYHENVWKNYIYTIFFNLRFTSGIWMLYLASRGMSLTQLGLLEGIFHVTSLVMEIPTGAIADLYGRKNSRLLGRLCSIISTLIFLSSGSFWLFAIAFFFSALSYNLESGAGEALVYDSMKACGKEKDFLKVTGIQEALFQYSGMLCLIIGGRIGEHSYLGAYWVTLIFTILSFFTIFSFVEPPRGVEKLARLPVSSILNQTLDSVRTVVKKKSVAFILVFTQSILACSTLLFFYLQNYWKSIGIGEAKIGMYLASGCLSGAIIANLVNRINRRMGNRRFFLSISWLSVVCLFGMALSPQKLPFFVLLSMADSALFVASSNFVNQMIPSRQRATILSIGSMLFSLAMIIIFPVFGGIADLYGFTVAFWVLAIGGILLVLLMSIPLLRTGSLSETEQE